MIFCKYFLDSFFYHQVTGDGNASNQIKTSQVLDIFAKSPIVTY